MPTTFDGPARAIKPPGPDPPADAAPPPGAGWLARTCCRVAGHAGDWTYPDERCVRVRMCQRCGDVTSKQEHEWSAFGYLAASRCEQERRCHRCGAIESRIRMIGVRGAMPVRTPYMQYARSPPAVAAARRSTPDLSH